MIATLIALMFAAAALFALAAMVFSWRTFGHRFGELRVELRAANTPRAVRYTWRDTAAPRASAVIYNLDFKAKADGLPFHPELRHEQLAAA